MGSLKAPCEKPFDTVTVAEDDDETKVTCEGCWTETGLDR
jgi:hypothetical protein